MRTMYACLRQRGASGSQGYAPLTAAGLVLHLWSGDVLAWRFIAVPCMGEVLYV